MSDELLVVLSRRGQVAWPTCRRYIGELYTRLGSGWPRPRHLESVTITTLQAIGHVAADFSEGSGVVRVAPRVLARLPVAGRPAAVLLGHRTADTQESLLEGCGRVRGADVTVAADGGESPFIPCRLRVEADSPEDLAAVATTIEARFDPNPAAWRVLKVAETAEAFRRSLLWRTQKDLNWERRDFDVTSARWTVAGAAGDGLAEFTDPRTGRRDYRLRRGDRIADVDRAWGCYVALADVGRHVLYFDGAAVFVPLGARPPAPFDAALTLCSGLAPRVVPVAVDSDRTTPCLQYRDIPRPLAELTAAKLGQRLVPVPSPEPPP